MTDARERRRARAENEKEGVDAAQWIKKNRIPLVIGLIWLLFVGYNVAAMQGVISADTSDDCPGHWHARFAVYADGDQVNFAGYPQFSQLGDSDASGFHLHNTGGSDPEIMHFHPAVRRCIPAEAALDHVGVQVDSTTLTLASPLLESGTYAEDANNTVAVYHLPHGGDWVEVSNIGSFLDGQLQNGDRLLIYHGDAAGVEAAQAGVSDLGANYEPGEPETDPKFMINIIATTVLALVAIMIFRGLTNAAK